MPSQHVLTQEEWVAPMAKRAMDRIRSELYLDLRYMNAALGALVPTPAAGLHNLATDGAALCYDPEWFIGLYRSNRRYLPRAVLHSVLHCVFRHPWLRGGRDASLWGLACDIAVEQTIDAFPDPSGGLAAAKNLPGTAQKRGHARRRAHLPLACRPGA